MLIERFVAWCLRRRHVVWAVFVIAAVYGAYSWTRLPIEAYPDIADVTAQVVTQVPGLAAEEVEQQITIPLERELISTPGLSIMRSKSTFALSHIILVFRDGVEDYWARQRIEERIKAVSLPYEAEPELDPLSSPIGEIYRYTLESKTRTLEELSEIQEWVAIPRYKQVAGVVDVANLGGVTVQFQLELDPAKLIAHNLSYRDVVEAVAENNANAGGSRINYGDQAFVIRGIGLLRNLNDLANVVVSQKDGTPIFAKDLGTVKYGHQERQGVVGKNGIDDAVQGMILLLRGENPSLTLKSIHRATDELNSKILPPDVKIVPFLDRTTLIDATTRTVGMTLSEGIALVVLVLVLFLGSPRGALIVAITIPLALLISFILMKQFNIPANLLSLGAIDFGIVVDGSIVMFESVLRQKELKNGRELALKDAYMAASQVAKPVFFATIIIITAYFPLFSFERVEYKLFSPMAFTVAFALFGALMVALALIPGLAFLAYRKHRKVHHNRILERLTQWYSKTIRRLINRPRTALSICGATFTSILLLGATIGRDFLPELDEGSLWLQVRLPPAVSLEKGIQMAGELRKATMEFPQVSDVVTQLGREDDGREPFTLSYMEVFVGLKPYKTWKPKITKHELIEQMSLRFRQLPGIEVGFSQPMIDMVNDKVAGAHSELVVKIFGDDFTELRRVAEQVKEVLEDVPGSVDVAIDQELPVPQIQIKADRSLAARYGINVADIAMLVQNGIGGSPIGEIFVDERRYDLAVLLKPESRNTQETIGKLSLMSPSGAQVALNHVAHIGISSGESTIAREMGHRHMTVKLNLRGRSLSSFLGEAQRAVREKVDAGVFEIQWGGQFEHQNRAQAKLALILPLTLLIMFALLFTEFRNIRHPSLILLAVPLSAVGGLLALHLRGMTLNISSAVGFIALFGVSVQNAIIMVSNLNRHLKDKDFQDGIVDGATERLRPVLMTALVAALGLFPASIATGLGSDVQRPLATVVVSGLITATVLTLLVLPVLYSMVERRHLRKNSGREHGDSNEDLLHVLDD